MIVDSSEAVSRARPTRDAEADRESEARGSTGGVRPLRQSMGL
jgi:hypothetical protein